MAEMLAIGGPERVDRIALVSTPPRLGGLLTPPFWHARLQWYHLFLATKRGAQAVTESRCWVLASRVAHRRYSAAIGIVVALSKWVYVDWSAIAHCQDRMSQF
jgi:hypothetical protein